MLEEYQRLESELLAFFRGEPRDFGSLALESHRFQRRWNQPFANFCATQPEPRDWREIPAVPQSAFKHFTLSVAPDLATKVFHTSGTSGQRHGRHTLLNTRLYEESVRAGWSRLGLARRRHLVLVAHPADAPHSSLAHMMGALDPLAVETVWALDRQGQFSKALTATLEHAEASGEPIAILGTALAFLNFFEQLGSRHFHLPAGSYAMETGGFKGSGRDIEKGDLYRRLGDFLDLAPDAVLNEYGMTELSSQFYSHGLGRPHTGAPWLRAIVFHPESGAEVEVGQTGALRLFDLANLGSVVALETQDLAVRGEEGFTLLGRDPGALPRGCSRSADELLQRV